MAYMIACLMAALSFLLNRTMLHYVGLQAVITYSPVVEEMAKTLLAFYLGADILLTHIGFGVIEAGYDWRTSKAHGTAAALFSIFGHGLSGLVTVGALNLTGSLLWALSAGIMVHLVWNVLAIRITT